MNLKADRCACGGDSTVTDTRSRGFWVARRRECLRCGERWPTRELRIMPWKRTEASLVDKEIIAKLEQLVKDLKAKLWVP